MATLTTWKGGLPQGAPTSPRLANLVNVKLDARLAGPACRPGARYTRYADDITFSFDSPDHAVVQAALGSAKVILGEEGYAIHLKKKLHIRRRLRAVAHHLASGRPGALTPAQIAGWRALESMVETQRQTA